MTKQVIEGSVALVTGANRGIGRAIVESLIDHGAVKVYAGARRLETVSDLAEQYGDRVVPIKIDVTNPDDVRAAAATATDVEILVNNAGVAEFGGAEFADPQWLEAGRREYDVNVLGTLAVTQAFAPALQSQGGGAVVNIVSIGGIVNFPLFFSYSLSKAALHSLTQGTRMLLAQQGTEVYGVYPGPVDTDMADGIEFEKATPRSVADEILSAIEAGTQEIFPDPMAKQFGEAYENSPKGLELQVIEMISEGAAA